MFFEFKNQIVLITGAAGGIGSTLVNKFSKYKAKVYPTDIKNSDHPNFIQGDISDPDFIHRFVEQIIDREGRVDILVNNAGICPRTSLLDINLKEWKKVMDINLTSLFLLSQAILRIMIKQKSGNIVNLASIAGKIGGITVGAHYSASKAAIECLTKSLAKSGAPHGVRVNSVAPGVIDTEMQNGISPEQIKQFRQSIPMGRMGTSDEVSNIILVLASNLASYVTGTTIDVNGGLYM